MLGVSFWVQQITPVHACKKTIYQDFSVAILELSNAFSMVLASTYLIYNCSRTADILFLFSYNNREHRVK